MYACDAPVGVPRADALAEPRRRTGTSRRRSRASATGTSPRWIRPRLGIHSKTRLEHLAVFVGDRRTAQACASETSALAEGEASPTSRCSLTTWTTSGSAGGDRCPSTKPAVSSGRLDPRPSAPSDETEQRPTLGAGRSVAAPLTSRGGPELAPDPDESIIGGRVPGRSLRSGEVGASASSARAPGVRPSGRVTGVDTDTCFARGSGSERPAGVARVVWFGRACAPRRAGSAFSSRLSTVRVRVALQWGDARG